MHCRHCKSSWFSCNMPQEEELHGDGRRWRGRGGGVGGGRSEGLSGGTCGSMNRTGPSEETVSSARPLLGFRRPPFFSL